MPTSTEETGEPEKTELSQNSLANIVAEESVITAEATSPLSETSAITDLEQSEEAAPEPVTVAVDSGKLE
jgi:hypothetical protein